MKLVLSLEIVKTCGLESSISQSVHGDVVVITVVVDVESVTEIDVCVDSDVEAEGVGVDSDVEAEGVGVDSDVETEDSSLSCAVVIINSCKKMRIKKYLLEIFIFI